MATVNLGSIKFKWKGTYSGATAYTIDDVVEYNGSSYICILASTGNLPTNATYFEQMSSAGTNGTNGTDLTTTLTTQGDLVYRDGSGLQRLGAGTAGQFLKTQGAGANPTWGTVTSKLLGEQTNVYQTSTTYSVSSQSAVEVTGLNTTYGSPVSSNSYFIVKCNLTIWINGNHVRGGLQYSTDGGSTWSSDWSHTRSGSTLTWGGGSTLYNYPHLATIQLLTDTNTTSQACCILKYAPTTPHSISDFRVKLMVWCQDAPNTIFINRVNNTNNAHSNTLVSSIEIQEYQA
jgi:hypothetical protein